MANYFVFENEETKERVLVKPVYHRRLHMYKLRNNVPVVKNIDWDSDLLKVKFLSLSDSLRSHGL